MYLCGHNHRREIALFGNTAYIIVDTCRDPEEKPYYMQVDMGSEIHYRFIAM